MHLPNPSRPQIYLVFGSILAAMFRSMPIWTILTLGISDALSQPTVVVDPSKEKKAWTITWSEGPVSLTEVWVETTQDTRRLGTFPGGSRGLEWNSAGDRLYYREKPLETKMIGIPLMERRSSPLSPPRVWELPVDHGVDTNSPGKQRQCFGWRHDKGIQHRHIRCGIARNNGRTASTWKRISGVCHGVYRPAPMGLLKPRRRSIAGRLPHSWRCAANTGQLDSLLNRLTHTCANWNEEPQKPEETAPAGSAATISGLSGISSVHTPRRTTDVDRKPFRCSSPGPRRKFPQRETWKY